jgi:hypothetical protein
MKRISFICSAITLLVAFFVTAGVSAQIDFEGDENGLRVNGKTIDPSNLPEGLGGMLAEADFSLHWGGSFPMRVTINGEQYEVWEDRIVESDKVESGNTHIVGFEIVANPGLITIGSPRPDRPGRPDLGNRERLFVRLVEANVDELDSLSQTLRVVKRSLRERPKLTPKQVDEIVNATSAASAMRRDALNMLEVSNYLADVLGASDELSELLRYEWREEFEARQMAVEINNMSAGTERDAAIAELRKKLNTIFHLKQDNRTREIRRMRLDLEKMQLQVEERNRNMERLIDMRLDELLGTGW